MDPLLLKVKKTETDSFSVNYFKYNGSFPGLWHYHSEYELTLIVKSSGTRFVGDHIDRYNENDLIFIGKNLAHTWKSDSSKEKNQSSEALVIHFKKDFLGSSFFTTPELYAIEQFLQLSQRGIKITGKTQIEVIDQMYQIQTLSGVNKLIKLLQILCLLADSKELILLSSEGYNLNVNENTNDRLNKVHAYIMNNFKSSIRLIDAADIAHMSPTAFSRYFKQRMQKPFSQFVNELKVGYACKLLMLQKFSIQQICFECGFQNVSNFNKQFKSFTGLSPKQFQLKHKSMYFQASLYQLQENNLAE
ncbi:AraC family transcriptional regulator [Larkinella rosea]|uniref:AraC family transcriptional regulator n=1 Tax=Larkinella rosea TaxID=2025312 RepID=A0A3P1BSV3_9BACT|nr:AraC family transcriptional regulator [Larkinella rosea]RRB04003.1 AraC family transcriptional regulator [Larkinella rosea]